MDGRGGRGPRGRDVIPLGFVRLEPFQLGFFCPAADLLQELFPLRLLDMVAAVRAHLRLSRSLCMMIKNISNHAGKVNGTCLDFIGDSE
jgi:hypothetical protein